MRHNDPSAGIILTLILLAVLIGLLVGVLRLILWGFARLTGGLFSNVPKPKPPADSPRTTPTWLYLVLVLGFGGLFWYFEPKKDAPNPPPAGIPWAWVLGVLGAGTAAVGVWVAFQLVRAFDSGIRRAQKRADAGDVEGALADLRKQIEVKGLDHARATALGALLLRHDRWGEASVLFRRAEELGGVPASCRANLGLALLKGGKPDQALPLLQSASQSNLQAPAFTCVVCLHTALALAALGRRGEALVHLLDAEAAAKALPRPQRDAIESDLQRCRRTLAEDTEAVAKPAPLEEL